MWKRERELTYSFRLLCFYDRLLVCHKPYIAVCLLITTWSFHLRGLRGSSLLLLKKSSCKSPYDRMNGNYCMNSHGHHLLSLSDKEQLRHSAIHFSVAYKKVIWDDMSMWVNDDRAFILGWITPLSLAEKEKNRFWPVGKCWGCCHCGSLNKLILQMFMLMTLDNLLSSTMNWSSFRKVFFLLLY